VRRIRNQAVMLRAYAKQAKNRQLEIDAAEIRIRAERRVGELIAEQRQGVGLAKPPGSNQHRVKVRPDARPTLADAGIDKHLADRARSLAAVPAPKFESLVSSWRDRAAHDGERVTTDVLRPSKMAVHHASETPEHYTPQVVIAAAIDCLGEIDLDPCSNEGEPNVPAAAHFTIRDNGLTRPWAGRVYMNPPYGREIDDWVAKLVAEYTTGKVVEAIALLPARTDTQWFQRLREYYCCFITGRLTFIGNEDPAPFPSAVFFLGEDVREFCDCFAALGDVWARVDREDVGNL
jgi:hypothetical protein